MNPMHLQKLSMTWQCPHCSRVHDSDLVPEKPSTITCAPCGFQTTLEVTNPPEHYCRFCHKGELYRQKDFNRRFGILLVIIAAAFAYPTYGISLAVAVILDVLVYLYVPNTLICYACQAHYRHFKGTETFPGFQLIKHDKYRTQRESSSQEDVR